MSIPTSSLKEFIEPVPVLHQDTKLAAVLEIFSSGQCDRLVIVSEQQLPVGVIHLRSVIPHLIASQQPVKSAHRASTGLWSNLERSLSSVDLSLIEPLVTLPAHITLSQFGLHLQSGGQIEETNRHWALVDRCGKFLGLLDSWLVLKKYIAPSRKRERDENQESILDLKPLIQLLEQLPIPLKLQTSTGQVLSQNLSWRQQIGELFSQEERSIKATDFIDNLAHEDEQWVNTHTNYLYQPNNTSYNYPIARSKSLPPRSQPSYSNFSVQSDVKVASSLASRDKWESDSRLSCPLILPQEVLATFNSMAFSIPLSIKTAHPTRRVQSAVPEDREAFASMPKNLKKVCDRVFSFVKMPLADFRLGDEISRGNPPVVVPTAAGVSTGALPLQTPKLVLVLAQDVTEQQQVAKELAAKNADLIQLNRFKDEFLACISHELKTPLTSIIGLSSVLKDKLVGELNERQTQYATLINQSGRTLIKVVNDILDLTRMETGQMELTLEPVDIRSVCDRAYSQAQQPAKDKQTLESYQQIPFTLDIQAGVETLVADGLRLRQMLVHLLSNALKFTDPTGKIGLKVSCWEGWIAFTVWDTGIGIPDTQQHLIFQKFQQLENPLTRQFDGTGLGLVLTQRLARLHGGDVSFISKAGFGSEFTVLLPPIPPQKGLENGNINPQPPISRLVLIVETAPRYIEDLTVQLTCLGYRFAIARSGTEAIEKARRLQPQAILLNPLLPMLSGWDVLTLLKSDSQTSHIPVIVTATQAEKDLAFSNRADSFLNLPVQEEALGKSLTRLTKSQQNTNSNLTVLRLNSDFELLIELQGDRTSDESSQSLNLNCQVIEADDLEQAELLAKIWHPDVVLLDGVGTDNPLAYLEALSLYTSLASLPLVTLDILTTQAANQFASLSVFPCLVPNIKDNTAALLQVLQVAAGTDCKAGSINSDVSPERLYN